MLQRYKVFILIPKDYFILHKYYLAFLPKNIMNMGNYQKSEVSKMEWKTYDECVKVIRPYNLEKKHVIDKIHKSLQDYKIIY